MSEKKNACLHEFVLFPSITLKHLDNHEPPHPKCLSKLSRSLFYFPVGKTSKSIVRNETPSAVEEQYFEAMMPVTILNDFTPKLARTILYFI